MRIETIKRVRNWAILFAALLMVFSVRPVLAATNSATGVWQGSISGQDGNSMTVAFDLKQDGSKLTGTVTGPQGDPMPIENGKVDGNKVSFDVSFNGMTITHEGTMDGNKMTLTTKSDGGMPAMNLTLTREKPASGQ